MNTIDLFDLIALRAKLLESYVKNEISKEKFQEELDRINEKIVSY
jgi:hypothetical protein